MTLTRTTLTLGLLIALGMNTQARADTGKTREQVRAELAEAIAQGDMLATGDSGLKLTRLPRNAIPGPRLRR